MSREERLGETSSNLRYSTSRGSTSRPRLYGGAGAPQRQLQLQRSISSGKKPPEPLRRAVADCLSSSTQNVYGSPSTVSSEAARTLRDYIASPSTIDLAYSVLIDHAIAERERSPAVVPRCVAILKRYLLRYVPKVETLRQIDNFCTSSIVDCDPVPNRRASSLTKSSSSLSGGSTISGSIFPYPLPAHNFASPSLVKSLNYVRSLVARHIPRLSFQQMPQIGPSNVGKQSLQTLSTLLRRSFNSHLSPKSVHNQESPGRKEVLCPPSLNLSNLETTDVGSSINDYIYDDLLKWRWSGIREQQSLLLMMDSSIRDSNNMRPQDAQIHGFLEVGAAALLLGDSKSKGEPHKHPNKRNALDAEQLLQPSTVTTAHDFFSSHKHLRAITASKRMKPDLQQFWLNVPVSTFKPRAQALFHYRYYSEQQPLRLNPAEISDVIAAVCLESSSPVTNPMTTSSRLSSPSGKPSADIAASVLIKLIIDMYVVDSGTAAPLTLSMLEDMLLCQRLVSRVRVFDIILNLGVHAHLLEPMLPEDPSSIGESVASLEHQFNDERHSDSWMQKQSSAINNFESWLLVILFEALLLLVQMEEREEIVWASALSCLFYFVCDKGKIQKSRLEGLDIRVIKALLEISREHAWAQVIRGKLICMLTNMFYIFSDIPTFLVEQVDLIGGIDFICLEYAHANSREEERDLFSVLFDYCLHQINGSCLASGISAYSLDEIQPLATMLALAEAPEAFYIAVKHGVEGIGEVLRRSIAAALSRSSKYDRVTSLLEKVTRKLDGITSSFTRLDAEFTNMIWITKSFKTLKSIEAGLLELDANAKAKLSWATLHALLHSERGVYRHNGYTWLVELLLSEINEEGSRSIWVNVRNLQQQMMIASSQEVQEASFSTASLPVSLLCGLLKSKHNNIRWGFLFVLEKLLIRCKLLLDGHEASSHNSREKDFETANAVIDLMSSALALVVQIIETDQINILKMCDILFSQLCVKLLPAHMLDSGNMKSKMEMANVDVDLLGRSKTSWNDNFPEYSDTMSGVEQSPLFLNTGSMAALLLRGCAVVPMQLITRVPVSLFYWPLFHLAGAATDDIALGVAVGSKGRGNLAGAASDIRGALLLLLIGKCTADKTAFSHVGGVKFFRELLEDMDSRVAYYSSAFLLKRMMTEEPDKYQRILQSLIAKAQQSNNEKLLENPYLQMCGIIQLSSDLGNQL